MMMSETVTDIFQKLSGRHNFSKKKTKNNFPFFNDMTTSDTRLGVTSPHMPTIPSLRIHRASATDAILPHTEAGHWGDMSLTGTSRAHESFFTLEQTS